MPSALQELPCYSQKAPSIRTSDATPTHKEVKIMNFNIDQLN